jgi:hypothetical protein
LEPNDWEPKREVVTRVLELAEGPAKCEIVQPRVGGRIKRGAPLAVKADRGLKKAEREEASRLLSRMLRLDEGPDTIREFHGLDPRWKSIGRGRLMRSPVVFRRCDQDRDRAAT